MSSPEAPSRSPSTDEWHPHRLLVVTSTFPSTSLTDDINSYNIVSPRNPAVIISETLTKDHLSIFKGYEELGTLGFAHDQDSETPDDQAARACGLFHDLAPADLQPMATAADLFSNLLHRYPVIDISAEALVARETGDSSHVRGLNLAVVNVYTQFADPARPYGDDSDGEVKWSWTKPESIYSQMPGYGGRWQADFCATLTEGYWRGGKELRLIARKGSRS